MTVPSGCDEWTHPPSDDADLSFGSPPSTQHNRVDLRWCEELEPEPEQPVILPSGGTSTKIAAGTSVNLQFGPESVLAHDGVHLVWGEGATDPDAPPQRSAFYGLGGASQAQAAELAQMAADGTEATIQAITTTQSPNNPDDRTPVADADAVAKDWDEQTRRIRLPTDNTDRAPDDMERVVTPQTVQRTLTLDLTKIGMLSAKINTLLFHIHQVRRSRINAISRLRALEAIGDNPIRGAWCADYTEDLSGEVATVEVPAEADSSVLRPQIRPGYAGRANYLPARDGQMFHREGQQGYQAYFNAAILPGVQRWRPQYRIGTITSIDHDADTCSLTIQGEDSSAQSLIIDPPDLQYTKADVPIVYMECNSEVFEPGDRVLIEFQGRDWEQPRVIGFETNPRPCCRFFGALHIHLVLDRNNVEAFFTAFDAWYRARALDLERCFRVQISVSQQYPRGFGTTSPAVLDWTQWWYQPQTVEREGILLNDFSDPTEFPRTNWGQQFDLEYSHTQPALMFWFRSTPSGPPESVLTPHPTGSMYQQGFYTNSATEAAQLMLPNNVTRTLFSGFYGGNAHGRDKALFVAFMPEFIQDDLDGGNAVSTWASEIETNWADTHWVRYSATGGTQSRVRAFPNAGHSNPPLRSEYSAYAPTHSNYTLPAETTTDVATGPADVAKLIEVIETELKARKMYVGPDPE